MQPVNGVNNADLTLSGHSKLKQLTSIANSCSEPLGVGVQGCHREPILCVCYSLTVVFYKHKHTICDHNHHCHCSFSYILTCSKSRPFLFMPLAKLENYSLLVKYVCFHFRPVLQWKPRIYVPRGARR